MVVCEQPCFADHSCQSVGYNAIISGLHKNPVRTQAMKEVAHLIVPPPKLAYTATLRCHILSAVALRMYGSDPLASASQIGQYNESEGPHQCGAASNEPLNLLSLTDLHECVASWLPRSHEQVLVCCTQLSPPHACLQKGSWAALTHLHCNAGLLVRSCEVSQAIP